MTDATPTILIVDDTEANLVLLHDLVLTLGYRPQLADNGLSALASIRTSPPDLVLLDILMPQMGGFEVLDIMRQDGSLREIPVVVVSAMDDQASIVRCIQTGADDYLIKPIDPVLLQARLGASLERKRLRDQETAVRRQIETYNLALEQRVREQVAQITATELERAKLSRYLSPSVVEQVLGAGQELALGGRRLEVTVLFTDIRGYTALSRRIDVGQVVELLNEHFTAVSEIIFEYGGTLDKFIGDSVMAVFGSPFASGSDARHAVLAAQDIQAMMARRNQLAAQTGLPAFEIGIGINTGNVISGNIGSPQKMDFTVIGSTVNLTARLTEMARGGEIMLGAATVAQLHGEFPVEPVGALELKNRPDVVEGFRLLPAGYPRDTRPLGKGG